MDDVEFTFRRGGAARTLGEATLRNRVKSHPDVGERWYPDILASVREEQARLKRQEEDKGQGVLGAGDGDDDGELPAASAKVVEAH